MDSRYIRIGPAYDGRAAHRTTAGLAAGALLLTGSVIGWSFSTADTARVDAAPAAGAAPPAAAARTLGAGVDSYADVIAETTPAVVTIRAERRVRSVSDQLPDNPLFREFFGERFRGTPRQPERREGGMGSGVVVRADGYILTNHHVVGNAEQVTVELTDGRSLAAEIVGSDEASDLAVLKVEGSNLQTLTLGDSDAVRVGDVVLAVGNPLGLGQTVTMGIVSAKGRSTGAGQGSFEDFIQTDAPINRGNSGGALVNTRGELIGINSQILSPSGGNIGIGFAIPANMARHVMTQLIDHGTVRRGMLGVTIQPVTSDIARSLGLDQVGGAIVSGVQPGSPAEKGGVRRGDVITAIDGQTVRDYNALRNQIAQTAPGSDVRLTVLRDGTDQTVTVKLGELEARDTPAAGRQPSSDETGYGMGVEPLTRERARQLNVTAASGLVVTQVDPSGRAAAAGLRSGDVVEEVDGTPVTTVDALRSALGQAKDRPALLLVHREGATVFVPLS